MKQILTKIFLLLCLLLCTSTVLEAQIQISATSGINLSRISGIKGDLRFGFYMGGYVDCVLHPSFSMATGLLLTTKGANDFIDEGFSSANAVYLEVPVMAKYNIALSQNAILAIGVGPYLSYGLAGNTQITRIEPDDDDVLIEVENIMLDTFDDGVLKKYDVGLGISLGIEHRTIVASLSYQLGLKNIADRYSNHARNQTFAVGVAYRFYSR